MEPVAELCMVHVTLVREAGPKVRIATAADAADMARQVIGDADRETFLVLLLDTNLSVSAAQIAAVGRMDHFLLHPREVFKAAVAANAASVVIAHKHPSGDPTPSPEDRAMTQRLWRAGELLGISVQDHVIVGHGRVYSCRAKGGIAEPGRRHRARGSPALHVDQYRNRQTESAGRYRLDQPVAGQTDPEPGRLGLPADLGVR